MDAIRPSAPQAQAPTGIQESIVPIPIFDPDRAVRRLNLHALTGVSLSPSLLRWL